MKPTRTFVEDLLRSERHISECHCTVGISKTMAPGYVLQARCQSRPSVWLVSGNLCALVESIVAITIKLEALKHGKSA